MARFGFLIKVVPVAGLIALGLTGAPPASASPTLSVTTTADSNPATGPCSNGSTTPPSPLSLRNAVCVANNLGGAVAIDVPAGTYDLSFGELDAGLNSGQDITLTGAGAASTTISAQGQSRVLNFDENLVGGIAATVQDVTITGGSDSTFGGAGIIGGSGNASSVDTLAVSDSVITGNQANNATPTATNNPGGGIQFIGGQLTITDSTISDNSAQSSPGAGVFYEAEGVGSPESFSMSGSTITGNTSANSTGSTVPTDGAVDLAAPTASIVMSVTDSAFTSNALTGTSGPVRGAGLTLEGGAVSVTDSSFSGNTVSGATSASGGGAIAVVDGTATVTDDRIVGNQAESAAVGSGIYDDAGAATATNDWWGCNAGPGSTGCDSVSGSVTTSPRVELTASAVTLPYNGTALVSANLDNNSAGTTLGVPENDLDGVAETFTNPAPSGTTCSPSSVTLSGGTASASCTFNPNGEDGTGDVVVTVDNQSITVPVTITEPPAITTNPTDVTVGPGGMASFTAAAAGFPAPSVQWQVSADGGNTYTNVPNATSTTLSFNATPADSGHLYQAVFTNSTGTATTTPALLTVAQAPAITSAASTTFTAGTSGSFTVTTTGTPTAALSESGALPSGVTFTDNGDGTATLAGTSAAGTGGSYPITITADNGVNPAATQDFTLTVNEAPSITSAGSTTFAVGSAGTFAVTTGGFPAAALSESGALPSGVTFTDNGDGTATLAGTPDADMAGSYPITITADNGIGAAATQSFTLTVDSAPSITSPASTTFTVATAGTFAVTTSAFPTAALSESGVLPSGVTFTDNGDGTATLAGTPAPGTAGSYPITITADNGVKPPATQNFTLTVGKASPWPAGVSGIYRPAAHSAQGYYLGASGDTWRLAVTHPGTGKVTFTGTITIPAGQLGHVKLVGQGPKDVVTVKPQVIRFTLPDYGPVAAIWFSTGPKVPQITFTLDINGQPAPGSQIYLGNPASQSSTGSPLTYTRQ